MTYFLEAGRGFISGEPIYVGLAFGAALGLAALFALWAVRGLRTAEAAGGEPHGGVRLNAAALAHVTPAARATHRESVRGPRARLLGGGARAARPR